MIRYALKCDRDHSFESWFQSANAFEKLRDAGHVACVVCGSAQVDRAMMAPRVASGVEAESTDETAKPITLSTPGSDMERALVEMRRKVEANSDYVGGDFAREARAMHLGDAPERAIWGEAKPAEAKALIEDGVPVAPLPFIPSRKAN